jgi:hypothetical protein
METASVKSHESYSMVSEDKYGYCEIPLYCTQKVVSSVYLSHICGKKTYKYLKDTCETYCNLHDPEKVKKTTRSIKNNVTTATIATTNFTRVAYIIESDSDDFDDSDN